MPNEPRARLDRRRVAAWLNLADHFLDTETRHQIPRSALFLVQSDFSVCEGRAIWDEEVAPAVGFNLALVAGEWAGWHEEWLVDRILSRERYSKAHPLGWLRRATAWLASVPAPENRATWTAIERCMRNFQEVDPSDRPRACEDLELLARLFFDFCPPERLEHTAFDKRRLAAVYADAFLPVFSPLVVPSAGESLAVFDVRVELALGFRRADLP